MFDPRTEKNLATLLPAAQVAARAFMAAAPGALPADVVVKIISGTRTYAEQDALYAQGRTKPGPRVTNARGGYSWHNFSLAFDIGLFRDGDYLEDSPLYARLGKVGKSVGLEWGGDWKGSLVDEPHYQFNPRGLSLAQLRQRKEDGEALA